MDYQLRETLKLNQIPKQSPLSSALSPFQHPHFHPNHSNLLAVSAVLSAPFLDFSFFICNLMFEKFINHAAGPKTIFFWAPLMKWGLVIAGLGDLKRPANQLSVSQSGG